MNKIVDEKKFVVRMITLEPFRVGGFAHPLGTDNPIAKIGRKPVVPGSSLKGALRSALDKVLIQTHYDATGKTWRGNNATQPCLAAVKPSDEEKELIKNNFYRRQSCKYPGHGTVCPVCYLLGAQGLNGFVRVPFLEVEGNVLAESLYSSRMDRALKTVSKATNRPYEFVPKDTVFTGVMHVLIEDSVLNWKLGSPRVLKDKNSKGDQWLSRSPLSADQILNDYLLKALKNIDILGGYRSKGFGRVKVEVEEI